MLTYEGVEYHLKGAGPSCIRARSYTGTWNGWSPTEQWEMDTVTEAISQCLHFVILLLHLSSVCVGVVLLAVAIETDAEMWPISVL